MYLEDAEKTFYIIENSLYCYIVIPFRLISLSATCQRLVTKMFHSQLYRNIKIYVNDMILKSKKVSNQMIDVEEVFDIL